MIPLTGPLEALGYILAPLLAALIGSALTAALSAYVAGLAAAVLTEALAAAAVVAVALSPKEGRHWVLRPMAMGAVLALGTVGAIALTVRLMLDDAEEPTNFLLPFAPAAIAAVVAFVGAAILAVRGLARWRQASRGLAPELRARSALRAAALAGARGVATAGFAFAWLLVAAAFFASRDGSETTTGDAALVSVFVFGVVGGLASLLAWTGRRRPASWEKQAAAETEVG